jgi:hypothetical protein
MIVGDRRLPLQTLNNRFLCQPIEHTNQSSSAPIQPTYAQPPVSNEQAMAELLRISLPCLQYADSSQSLKEQANGTEPRIAAFEIRESIVAASSSAALC